MSSHDLLGVGSQKSSIINKNGVVGSVITPHIVGYNTQDRFVEGVMNSQSLNDDGLLGGLMTELRKDRKEKIENALKKLNTGQ